MFDVPLDSHAADENSARLRIIADTIDEQSRRLDMRVDTLHYEGPAARRFRGVMSERHQRAHRITRRLHEMADRIQSSGQTT